LLQRRGWRVRTFLNAIDCLEALHNEDCDLLIIDVNLPRMDGMELLRHVKRLRPSLPVLMVTGYGEIPLAVEAIKDGAADFIEKPLERTAFLQAVELALGTGTDPLTGKMLTKVEKRVLGFILEGKTNREIADTLHRSIRTIEDHRARIMRKLGVDNVVDLVKKAISIGVTSSQHGQTDA